MGREVTPVPDIVAGLEVEQRRVLVESFFTGPLPSPDMMLEYNKTVANGDFAERLLQLTENEQVMVSDEAAHRRSMEVRMLDAQIWQAKTGTFVGVFIVLCLIAIAGYAISQRQQAVAIAALTLDIGYIVGVFIAGDVMQVRERLKKLRRRSEQNPNEHEP